MSTSSPRHREAADAGVHADSRSGDVNMMASPVSGRESRSPVTVSMPTTGSEADLAALRRGMGAALGVHASSSGLTLEQLYAGDVPPHLLVDSAAALPVAPLCAYACVAEGINPRELLPRAGRATATAGRRMSKASTEVDTVDTEIEELRNASAEAARRSKLEAVVAARRDLADRGHEDTEALALALLAPGSPKDVARSKFSASGGTQRSGASSRDGESDGGLARIAARHVQEIERMMALEGLRTQAAAAAAERDAAERERAAARRATMKAKRHPASSEAEKHRLALRQQQRELEEAEARRAAALQWAQEREKQAALLAATKAARQRAAEEHTARLQRINAAREDLVRCVAVKETEIRQRWESMQSRDEERRARRQHADKQRREVSAARREASLARMRTQRAAAEELEAMRVAAITEREALLQERMAQRAADEARLRASIAAAQAHAEVERETVRRAAKELEEQRRRELEEHHEQRDAAVAAVLSERDRQQRLLRVAHDIESAQRQEAVQRAQRREEFRQLLVLHRIREREARMAVHTAARDAATRARRRGAYELARTRAAIVEMFDKARHASDPAAALRAILAGAAPSAPESTA